MPSSSLRGGLNEASPPSFSSSDPREDVEVTRPFNGGGARNPKIADRCWLAVLVTVFVSETLIVRVTLSFRLLGFSAEVTAAAHGTLE